MGRDTRRELLTVPHTTCSAVPTRSRAARAPGHQAGIHFRPALVCWSLPARPTPCQPQWAIAAALVLTPDCAPPGRCADPGGVKGTPSGNRSWQSTSWLPGSDGPCGVDSYSEGQPGSLAAGGYRQPVRPPAPRCDEPTVSSAVGADLLPASTCPLRNRPAASVTCSPRQDGHRHQARAALNALLR